VIKREDFEKRKAAAESARSARLNKRPKKLASQGRDLSDTPLLQARLLALISSSCVLAAILAIAMNKKCTCISVDV
jgi:hypothetical protein